jgi:hypothetical protein
MESRDMGSHANDVETVCIAISLLNILGTAMGASEAGGAEGAVLVAAAVDVADTTLANITNTSRDDILQHHSASGVHMSTHRLNCWARGTQTQPSRKGAACLESCVKAVQ